MDSYPDTAEYKSDCNQIVAKAKVTLMEKKMLEALVLARTTAKGQDGVAEDDTLEKALSEIKLQTQNMGTIKPTDLHTTIWTSCGLLMRGDSPFQK